MGRGADGSGEQSGSAGQDDRSARRTAISNWFGVFGVIFTILSTFVTGDPRTKLVIACTVAAAVLALLLVAQMTIDQRRSRRRSVRIALQGVVSVALIVAAVAISSNGRSDDAAGGPSPPTSSANNPPPSGESPVTPTTTRQDTPSPFIAKQGYVLRPSSSIDKNDQDKVDVRVSAVTTDTIDQLAKITVNFTVWKQ